MKKRKQEPKPLEFQYVTLDVSCPGRSFVYCAVDDPRADTFWVNSKGERTSAARTTGWVWSVEVRSKHEMTGACRKNLHDETWIQPPREKPVIPANALFIAKAFELAASQ